MWGLYFFYNMSRYQRWIKGHLVQNYLELEQKKGSLKRTRSKLEIKRLKEHVKSKLNPGPKNQQNETIELLFNSNFAYENLIGLSFKSSILLKIFAGAGFDVLSQNLILTRKLNKSRKSQQNGLNGRESAYLQQEQARNKDEEAQVGNPINASSSRAQFVKKLSFRNRQSPRQRSRLQAFIAGNRPGLLLRKSSFGSSARSKLLIKTSNKEKKGIIKHQGGPSGSPNSKILHNEQLKYDKQEASIEQGAGPISKNNGSNSSSGRKSLSVADFKKLRRGSILGRKGVKSKGSIFFKQSKYDGKAR